MNINELSESKYLKKEDCMPPINVTISGLTNENLARDGEPAEMKYILQFAEAVKPMVLNKTNANLIAMILNSPETNDWTGKKITLWNDPTVSFADKITGGIRVQMPQQAAVDAPMSEDPGAGMNPPELDTPF